MLKDTEECANWYVYGWLEGIPDISKPWHAEGHEFRERLFYTAAIEGMYKEDVENSMMLDWERPCRASEEVFGNGKSKEE
jgi:hypothetical protein